MSDTFGPRDEQCGICAREGLNRTRSEHGQDTRGFGHVFASIDQLADVRRRPADPTKTIRKMTDEDKARAATSGRVFADASPATKATTALVADNPSPCDICRRPKRNHRGSIGHRFTNAAAGIMPRPLAPPAKDLAARLPIKETPPVEKKNGSPTLAQVAAEIERALRSVRVRYGQRLRIGQIGLKPTFSIDDDAELLSVEIRAEASMIFASEGDQA